MKYFQKAVEIKSQYEAASDCLIVWLFAVLTALRLELSHFDSDARCVRVTST